MRTFYLPLVAGLTLLASPVRAADMTPGMPMTATDDARISALEAQVAALQKQLDALRAGAPAEEAAPPNAAADAADTTPAPDTGAAMPGHDMGGTSFGNVTVGGMVEMQFTSAIGGSLKQAVFSNPKGNSDFILPHVHPMISAQLNDKTSAMAMWCLTHVGTTALYQAYLDYAASDAVDVKAGRWLLPFGAWNPISNPAQFKSVSRPLMYLGHEERNIVLQGGPRPILNDEHSDVGLQLSGQVERGSAIYSYAAWASNGFQDTFGNYPDAWIDFRPSEDNNGSKSLGARLAVNVKALTLGASYTGGRYDPANKYDYRIRGVDATWRGPAGLTLRAEYADNPIQRAPGDGGNIRRRGWYAMAERPVAPKWTAVAMYSALTERPAPAVEKVSRLTLGAAYQLAPTAMLKAEVGRLFIGDFVGDAESAENGTDFNDVTTFKLSTVVSF
jgi:hypothetical protein